MSLENTKKVLEDQFFGEIALGNIDGVIEALEQKVDLNALTTKGNNGLFVAASRKQRDVFDWLLEVTQQGKPIDINNRNVAGATLLFECVQELDMHYYVEKLIQMGADVNMPNASGMTPLMYACANNKEEEVALLLNAPNIDINAKIPHLNTTAFLIACGFSNMNIIKMLVDNNADIDVKDQDGKNAILNTLMRDKTFMKKHEKKTHALLLDFLISNASKKQLEYVAPTGLNAIWAASYDNNEEIAKKIIDKGVNVDFFHNLGMDGKTSVLHFWAKAGNEEMVQLLLEKGAKLGMPDGSGNNVEAYGFYHPQLQKILLDNNADVNSIYTESKGKQKIEVPISQLVISKGDINIETVKIMIDRGMKLFYDDPKFHKFDPLFTALVSDSPLITQLLLDTGKIDLNRHLKLDEKAESFTLLGYLVSNLNNKEAKQLNTMLKVLENQLAKNNNDMIEGKTEGLLEAEELLEIQFNSNELKNRINELGNVHEEKIKLLIAHGAKINNENELGHTEIFFANKRNLAQLLIDNNADIFHTDKNDMDILLHSVINGKNSVIGLWKEHFINANHPTVDNILYQLAFEDFTNEYKKQATYAGIIDFFSDTQIKEVLSANNKSEEKPELNISQLLYKDEDGNTPLLVACANNKTFLIELFVKMGADVNATNSLGETPLMHALANGNVGTIKYLIANNADLTATTLEGKSVLDMAKELDNKSIITLMMEEQAKKIPEEKKTLRL